MNSTMPILALLVAVAATPAFAGEDMEKTYADSVEVAHGVSYMIDDHTATLYPDSAIVAMVHGNPFLIDASAKYMVYHIHLPGEITADLTAANLDTTLPLIVEQMGQLDSIEDVDAEPGFVWHMHIVGTETKAVDESRGIAISDTGMPYPIQDIVIDYNRTIADLRQSVLDNRDGGDFHGDSYISYNFESAGSEAYASINYNGRHTVTTNPLDQIDLALRVEGCADMPLASGVPLSGTVLLDSAAVDAIYSCESEHAVNLVVTVKQDDQFMLYDLYTPLVFWADFISMGIVSDGSGHDRVLNWITRSLQYE